MSNHTPPDWSRLARTARQALRGVGDNIARKVREVERSELARTLNRLGRTLTSEEFGRQVVRGLEGLQAMLDDAFPPNWRTVGRRHPSRLPRIVELMAAHGWSLARTPPPEVLVALLGAPDVETQERILLDAEAMILEDLDRLLRANESPTLTDVHSAAIEALETYASGYFIASQATSTAALTSIVHNHLKPATFKPTLTRLRAFDPEDEGLRLYRFAAVMRAFATALDEWWHTHPPRQRYNRHNSAHKLGAPQYRQVNALTALMLLVSVELELEFAAAQSAP